MSDKIRITAFGEDRELPKNDETLEILNRMKANGVEFTVSPVDAEPSKPNPLLEQTPPEKVAGAVRPAPAPPADVEAPKPAPENPETFGTMAGDFAVPALNGMTLGFGDELAGLVSPKAQEAMRARLALASRRSPYLAGAGNITGALGTTLATGGLGGGGALTNLARVTALGAAAGAGNNEQDRLEGAMAGGARSLGTGAIGAGVAAGGRLASAVGDTLKSNANNPAMTELLGKVGTGVVSNAPAAAGISLGPLGALLGLGARGPLKRGVEKPIQQLAEKYGPAGIDKLGSVVSGGGNAAQAGGGLIASSGPAIATMNNTVPEVEQATRGIPGASMLAQALRQYPRNVPPGPPTPAPSESAASMVSALSAGGPQSSVAMSALDHIRAELSAETDEEKRKAKLSKMVLTDPVARDEIKNIYNPREGFNNSF